MPIAEKLKRNEEMYQDYLNGMSMYDIALKYGVRQPTVHQIVTRMKKRKEEDEKSK